MDDCLHILNELAHLGLDCILAIATIALAVFTCRLWTTTQDLLKETKHAAEKQLGVTTWLDFVKRFDAPQMDAARLLLMQNIAQQLDTVDEQMLEFYEELGVVYLNHCIDKKLTHSAFSYDAQHVWHLAYPWIIKMRQAREDFYCDFQKMLETMDRDSPGDPPVTDEMAAAFLKKEIGPSILNALGES
jgi:hypothetical protein